MTSDEREVLRVRGAVTVRDDLELAPGTATWPFGLLRSTESRISISSTFGPGVWSSAWQEVRVALVSRRTATFVSGDGSRMRFTAMRSRTFDEILHEVGRHGVPIRPTCSAAWDLAMPLAQLLIVASWVLVVLGLSLGPPGLLIGTVGPVLGTGLLIRRYRALRAAADAAS